jgi:hypothetical protein
VTKDGSRKTNKGIADSANRENAAAKRAPGKRTKAVLSASKQLPAGSKLKSFLNSRTVRNVAAAGLASAAAALLFKKVEQRG